MKLYGLSGLGADERVFQFLNLDIELIPIEWILPEKQESISDYSSRLSAAIDTNEKYGFLGVSFGGLVAVEMSKVLNPEIVILVSSIEVRQDLRPVYRLLGKTGLLNLIPSALFNPPIFLANCFLGAENKKLLGQILFDTDLKFAKWAVGELASWKNETKVATRLMEIGSSSDKLLPAKKDGNTKLIENGQHFMIVDRGDEVSSLINEELKGLI